MEFAFINDGLTSDGAEALCTTIGGKLYELIYKQDLQIFFTVYKFARIYLNTHFRQASFHLYPLLVT